MIKNREITSTNWEHGKYVDIRRFMKYTKQVRVRLLLGKRGIGKSTNVKRRVEYHRRRNGKFVWLFRLDEEVELKKRKIMEVFPNFVVEGYNVYEVLYDEHITKNGNKKRKLLSKEWVGEVQALNNASKMRSGTDYPNENFTLLIWDEFIDENGRTLTNEFELFKSIIETVFRTRRDIEIWCLTNDVDPTAPIFSDLDVPAHKMSEGDVFVDYGQDYAVYFARQSEELLKEKQQSVSMRFGNKSAYNSFAHTGGWRKGNADNLLAQPDQMVKPQFNVLYAELTFGVYKMDNGCWWVSRKQIENGKTYPLTQEDALKSNLPFTNPTWFLQIVNYSTDSRNIKYDSAATRELISKIGARLRV